jgi:MFS family permease
MSATDTHYLISKSADRWNGFAFGVATVMSYLAAPVIYIGMVQAALCSRLGGNASISNLPVTISALTGVIPLFASWMIPYRRERAVVVWCALLASAALAITAVGLVAPLSNFVRIGLVVGCSLLVFLLSSIQQVYLYQCLSRGTTEQGRARTLRTTFALGPLAAVAGSLCAQALLDGRWLALEFPRNFAAIYLFSIPCILVVALAASWQRVVEVPERPRRHLTRYLAESFRALTGSRTLSLLVIAYALTCAAVTCEANLTLYVHSTLGKAPELLVGYVMAVRFAGKSMGGLLLGYIAQRWNSQTVLVVIEILIVAGCLWALLATGIPYLFCFALLGTGELAGAYFPNYCLSASTFETGARNLALLAIFASLAGAGAAIHGLLADSFGYQSSIVVAGIMACAGWLLVRRLPSFAAEHPDASNELKKIA